MRPGRHGRLLRGYSAVITPRASAPTRPAQDPAGARPGSRTCGRCFGPPAGTRRSARRAAAHGVGGPQAARCARRTAGHVLLAVAVAEVPGGPRPGPPKGAIFAPRVTRGTQENYPKASRTFAPR